MAFGAGLEERRVARKAAARTREIGLVNEELRGIQAAELLGSQAAAQGASGFRSDGTFFDIREKTALLEGHDMARTRFRQEALAAQVEAQGEASFMTGFMQLVAQVGYGVEQMQEIAELERMESRVNPTPAAPAQMPGTALQPVPEPPPLIRRPDLPPGSGTPQPFAAGQHTTMVAPGPMSTDLSPGPATLSPQLGGGTPPIPWETIELVPSLAEMLGFHDWLDVWRK